MGRKRNKHLWVTLPKPLCKHYLDKVSEEDKYRNRVLEELIKEDWEAHKNETDLAIPTIDYIKENYEHQIRLGKHRSCRSTKRL